MASHLPWKNFFFISNAVETLDFVRWENFADNEQVTKDYCIANHSNLPRKIEENMNQYSALPSHYSSAKMTKALGYSNLLGFQPCAQVNSACIMHWINCDVRRSRVINNSVLHLGVRINVDRARCQLASPTNMKQLFMSRKRDATLRVQRTWCHPACPLNKILLCTSKAILESEAV
jgi:hypothetical protein